MSAEASAADAAARPTSFRAGTVSAQDALRLHYRDYPPVPGAPRRSADVLCLGGLTRNSRDFHGLGKALQSRGFRVVAPDYRGRGRSEYAADWRSYTPETYLDDVRHLCSALRLHRVVVIGTSLGGALAMGMAVAMPTVLAGAVLNDIGPKIESENLADIFRYMRSDPHFETWDQAADHVKRNFPDFPAESDDDWLAIAKGTYREGPDGKLTFDWDPAILKPLARDRSSVHDLSGYFRALGERPVLALRGERSDILDAETFETMSTLLPRIRCVTVPGVGHAPGLAEPTSREALDDFFRSF